ncbi:hypothetical protein C7H79_02920 [Nitrosomonas supralitoralis]|uniref:Uncharacterized protein n=1 Tax=Nitrosomonas supralitoralis TaxID=2116706 RepID=A0A2P7NXZ3_9PROT|nr:hypothetical protein C7H79_02920 [Nitrosomonas supralitoralis]
MANYEKCKRCEIRFLMVRFLDYRTSGYCTWECSIGEPPGAPTAESMAWKDKISVHSLRERMPEPPKNNVAVRKWKFDMVHYPPSKGWQIENWRWVDEAKRSCPLQSSE